MPHKAESSLRCSCVRTESYAVGQCVILAVCTVIWVRLGTHGQPGRAKANVSAFTHHFYNDSKNEADWESASDRNPVLAPAEHIVCAPSDVRI